MTKNDKSIQTVLEEHTDFLFSIDGVFSVSEGRTEDGSSCILVHIEKITDEKAKKIHDKIDGYFVNIIESDKPSLF